jgi:DNA processing protein
MVSNLEEQLYLLLLASKSGLSATKVNGIIETWCQQAGRALPEFFAVDPQEWEDICHLDVKAIEKLKAWKDDSSGRPLKAILQAEQALVEQLARQNMHMVTVLDEHYPKTLKSPFKRYDIPPVLFYAGDLRILDRPTIAIIGSRHARESSIAFTLEAARYLARRGVNIVSGNARGVDHAAYEGAMGVEGSTTVVLPQGIRKLSGKQVEELLPGIESGKVLLLSQFHPDASWLVGRAMERNKVVTGLSQVMIVAESGLNGGTWEGANYALEQKLPVYVRRSASPTLFPGNEALIERGGRPLDWPEDEYVYVDGILSPVLQEGDVLYYRQKYMLTLSQQLSRLLREEGMYDLSMDRDEL